MFIVWNSLLHTLWYLQSRLYPAEEGHLVNRSMTENGVKQSTDQAIPLVTTGNQKSTTDCEQPKDTMTSEPERESWGRSFEFLLSVIGFAVDLGNVWRFPYICYANGGGAFLIPYFVMYALGGLPLFYLELALGQYQRVGCITVWRRICPIFKGIGFGICVISFYVSIYYNTVIAWALYFFFASLRAQLPWANCENEWNTIECISLKNVTPSNYSCLENASVKTATQEYYNYELLEVQNADGFNNIGTVKWSISLCLLAVFIIVYFSLWKGIKTSGKVVWFTAIFPYVVLVILLIRGATLEGAGQGIMYYLRPQWHKLKDYKVWNAAAAQVFFSLGPGFGVLLALSSYNKPHNNCYRDALVTSSINCMTSLLAGFVVFSGLGYMAHKLNICIENVATDGMQAYSRPGLVFEVYPEVISQLPGSPFFSAIFFLMLITLGLDSTYGGLEALITGVLDEWTNLKKYREIFVAVLLSCSFLASIPTTTYGGKYLVQLLDSYAAPVSILFIVLMEALAVSVCYGVKRFSKDIEYMLGFQPGIFWKVCWAAISPIFIAALFGVSIYDAASSSTIEIGGHVYPWWANYIKWIVICSSIVCLPLFAVYKLLVTKGTLLDRLKICMEPEETHQLPSINESRPHHFNGGIKENNNNTCTRL